MLRLCTLALALSLVGCGGPKAPRGPEPQSGPDLSPALAPIAWMTGDWAHEHGVESWIATAGVLYGVGFTEGGGYEAMLIDDALEDADGAPDGTLRLYAMPGGAAATIFTATGDAPNQVRFINPTHDDPTAIEYQLTAGSLTATVSGPRTNLVLALDAAEGAPSAPEAEAADRAFARATDADGIDGWMAWFADDGAMLRGDQRLTGDAIRARMAPLLARADLLWEPVWSRLSPDGTLAATVGRARIVEKAAVTWRGSYLTIWRNTADGWRVVLDVGRNENTL